MITRFDCRVMLSWVGTRSLLIATCYANLEILNEEVEWTMESGIIGRVYTVYDDVVIILVFRIQYYMLLELDRKEEWTIPRREEWSMVSEIGCITHLKKKKLSFNNIIIIMVELLLLIENYNYSFLLILRVLCTGKREISVYECF